MDKTPLLETTIFNISAEQSVLSAIFVDNTVIAEIGALSFMFYREAHKQIYDAMTELYLFNSNIDVITLEQKLRDRKQLESVGGLQYLIYLSTCNFTATNVKEHVAIMRECALKREMLMLSEEIKVLVQGEDINSENLIQKFQSKLDVLSLVNQKEDDVEDIANTLAKSVAELKRKAENNEAGLKTDFIDFDNMTGGLYEGDLVVLAARPGMGKTAFALNIARNIVYKQNKSVLFASLEMSKQQLQYRLLSSMTGVELSKFRQPTTITPDEWKRLQKANQYHSNGYLDVYANAKVNVADITHRARQCQHQHGLDLIIVDYLQLMEGKQGKNGNREQEVSAISRSLKTMAMDLKVPVIVLSQLNRGVESRDDKRPRLSDLRESGSIEQDADMVLFTYRDTYYDKESDNKFSELIVAKNRSGPRDTVYLYFNESIATFCNLSKR